jgi:eukaryotic-like serine/threonine-protein kinase
MSDSPVYIEIIEGGCQGQRFDFEDQDTFMIGRARDCQCIVKGDNTFSRHHLFLEINQSNVTLKDLGSLNGTRVNGRLIYEGRGQDVDPEQAEPSKPIGLRDGDQIRAGTNVMILRIVAPKICVDCGEEIPAKDKKACEFVNGSYLCLPCRQREEEKNKPGKPKEEKKPADVRMNPKQREQAEQNPGVVVDDLVREFLRLQGVQGAPPAIQGYTDLKKIGEGGYGAVYKARRLKDSKTVAIKTMLQTRRPDRKKLLIFEREKEIITQLKHPNIVRSESAGVWNDIHFIEMDLVEGGSMWDMMQAGVQAIDLKTAIPLILQMLEGLAYAHEAELIVSTDKGKKRQTGVIHRDLKPPNVLLARVGGKLVAQLSDFGLAKAFGAAGCTQGSLSQTGTCCGSPPYMAPEHLINYKYVKPSTDVFEMAATIFHILTGQLVRSFPRGRDPFRCVLEETPRRIKDYLGGCPKGLSTVMDRALSVNQKDRYKNGRDFLDAMRKAL